MSEWFFNVLGMTKRAKKTTENEAGKDGKEREIEIAGQRGKRKDAIKRERAGKYFCKHSGTGSRWQGFVVLRGKHWERSVLRRSKRRTNLDKWVYKLEGGWFLDRD